MHFITLHFLPSFAGAGNGEGCIGKKFRIAKPYNLVKTEVTKTLKVMALAIIAFPRLSLVDAA